MCFYKQFPENSITIFCNNKKVTPNKTKHCFSVDCDVCNFFADLYGYKHISMFINNGIDVENVLMKRTIVNYGI